MYLEWGLCSDEILMVGESEAKIIHCFYFLNFLAGLVFQLKRLDGEEIRVISGVTLTPEIISMF